MNSSQCTNTDGLVAPGSAKQRELTREDWYEIPEVPVDNKMFFFLQKTQRHHVTGLGHWALGRAPHGAGAPPVHGALARRLFNYFRDYPAPLCLQPSLSKSMWFHNQNA